MPRIRTIGESPRHRPARAGALPALALMSALAGCAEAAPPPASDELKTSLKAIVEPKAQGLASLVLARDKVPAMTPTRVQYEVTKPAGGSGAYFTIQALFPKESSAQGSVDPKNVTDVQLFYMVPDKGARGDTRPKPIKWLTLRSPQSVDPADHWRAEYATHQNGSTDFRSLEVSGTDRNPSDSVQPPTDIERVAATRGAIQKGEAAILDHIFETQE